MSEQDDKPTGFRRVSRKDRKRKLETRGPLFPPEPEAAPADEDAPEFAPPELRAESAAPEKVVPTETPASDLQFQRPTARPPKVDTAERFPPLAHETEKTDTKGNVPAEVVVRPRSSFLPNLIAVLFAIASVVLIIVFGLIYVNPYTPLNPFPPFTPIPILITATFLPPTATLSPTPGPTLTFTPLPVEAIVTDSPFPFIAANEGAVYIPNANDQGCNWSSIAGTVTDINGVTLDGYGIRVRGDSLDETVFTGATQTFGPGGFELFLNGTPAEATYTVQLLSPQGAPLSQEIIVNTRATCEENVAVISFMQIQGL
jgi:hypothetical protein